MTPLILTLIIVPADVSLPSFNRVIFTMPGLDSTESIVPSKLESSISTLPSQFGLSFNICGKNINIDASIGNGLANFTPTTKSVVLPATKETGSTVNPVNDVPVSTDMNITIDEDAPGSIGLNATDIEGPTTEQSHFIYSIVSQPTNGSISIPSSTPNNTATYIPNANFNGTDSFTFKANDGEDDGNVATVNITINAVNDAPTTNDISVTIDENLTARIVGITLEGSDVEGDDLTYSIVDNSSNGGNASISGSILTYAANQDWNGTDTITYKANDGELDSNVSTVTIVVNSINDAPVATDVEVNTNEDEAISYDLSNNVSDVEGDNLTYTIVDQPEDGTLSLDGSTITYTPNSNYNGSDTGNWKVSDGTDESSTKAFTVIVYSSKVLGFTVIGRGPTALKRANRYRSSSKALELSSFPIAVEDTCLTVSSCPAFRVKVPSFSSRY